MSRYNLSDIQSSTLILSTDSVREMFDVVHNLVQEGDDGLSGLSLSVKVADTDEYVEFDDADILSVLKLQGSLAAS